MLACLNAQTVSVSGISDDNVRHKRLPKTVRALKLREFRQTA